MKKNNLILTLGAALLLAPLTATFAQTWQTVDELSPWRGRDIVADANGSFISLAIDNGATGSGGVVSTVVRLSADHGVTWETVGAIAGYANDLAVAPGGTALFAMGNRSATVSGRAFLWQSLDHGATWATFDPSAGSSQTFLALDVAVGNSGDIYLCGYFYGGNSWAVRKGHPMGTGGFTWSTVDSQSLGSPQSVSVRPGAVGQPDEVFVCGGGVWTVRGSLNGGATWSTLDSTSGSAYSLTTAPDGAIFVAGQGSITTYVTNQTVIKKKVVTTVTSTSVGGWLVRKSVNNGASWANVDIFANARPYFSNALAADAFGRVFVVGFSLTDPNSWLVRGSADGGATWVLADSFPPGGTTRAQAMGVAVDALGNVCVIGEMGTTASTYSAPIRRLAAP